MSDLYTEILKYEHGPLSESDLFTLKENYANMIIDGMDMDSLCQFAFDSIIANLNDYNEDDLREEVLQNYDEETLHSLYPEQWLTHANSMMI